MTVGTELLLGDTIDTDAVQAGRMLAASGIRVSRRATVGDVAADMTSAINEALDRTGLVLVSGGLGPTRDDITRDVVADLLECPLEFDTGVWEELVARWARAGRTISESNRSQAMVPRGGTVLPNRRGSAPGLWLETSRGVVILLPGVPIEFESLLAEQVVPRLQARSGSLQIRSRIFRTSGIPESRLGELLAPLEASMLPVTLAYLPDQTGVDLRLTAWELPGDEAEAALDRAEAIVRDAAGTWIYGMGRTDLAEQLLDLLREMGLTLATAESCTGGMIGARITSITGSSDVYLGGAVAYADAAKVAVLGVPADLIAAHGAVSEEVARAMALGAAARLGASVAVSVTGIAGPGGGSETKPVGTVCLGWAIGGEASSRRIQITGDREQVRLRASHAALLGLYQLLGDL
ncbi:MAG TPA: competence/damage-inducible protein A [Gemmatimonadales bacterium]|nr:competence/damage-inducible protein A [Gemmatimonadales bacterium]